MAYCEPDSGTQKSRSRPLWKKPSLDSQLGYRPSSGLIRNINILLLWLIQPGSLEGQSWTVLLGAPSPTPRDSNITKDPGCG